MVEETYRKDFPVSWEEMHRDAKALAWRLQDKGPWKGVVAITRGGMVPACIVAREIDILTVQTLCIASYDYKDQSKAKLLHEPSLEDGGKGWLVIDDLADTGKTFKLAREILPNAHFACIYLKPAAAGTADTFVTEVSQDTWIDFPWECDALTGTPQKK